MLQVSSSLLTLYYIGPFCKKEKKKKNEKAPVLEKLEKIVVGIPRLCWIQTRLKTQSQSFNLPLPMKYYHAWLNVIPKHLRRELLECYATNGCQTFKNVAYLSIELNWVPPAFVLSYREPSGFFPPPPPARLLILSPGVQPPPVTNSSNRCSVLFCFYFNP